MDQLEVTLTPEDKAIIYRQPTLANLSSNATRIRMVRYDRESHQLWLALEIKRIALRALTEGLDMWLAEKLKRNGRLN